MNTDASTTGIPSPRAHGGDGPRLAAALGIEPGAVLDLSMSMNPYAPDIEPIAAAHLGELRRYPDPEPARDALARSLGVAPGRLVLTNGGAEAIALVAAEQPIGHVEGPEFSLYSHHLERDDPRAPRWRSNPNNPTGQLAPSDATADVWDEAFYPLATGQWTRGDDAIVIGSLTKLFACPGLRAGYVIAPDRDVAAVVAARQPAWSMNGLACAVIPALLALADLAKWAAAVACARDELVRTLRAHDLAPDPSDANFLLVRDAPGLRTHLARSAVLVRDTANFGVPNGVRVAVPDADGLDRLDRALRGYR
jgi:histidinol-phosphate/aromatic aminotransferase/cobyric acid decarboxylase-like protein